MASWNPQDIQGRGIPSEELINLYQSWGNGGYGVVLTGNTMIAPEHLESPGNMIIPADAPFSGIRFDAFEQLARQGKSGGALLLCQLSHPGRQVPANVNPNPISAGDVQLTKQIFGLEFGKPRSMTAQDIKAVVHGFARAAEYCYRAGFDGVHIQAGQ